MGNQKGIDIIIPQDIRDYKAKAIGPFTIRQTVALLCIIVVAMLTTSVEKSVFNMEQTTLLPALFLAVPIAIMGFGDKAVGMPMEVYLSRVFFSAVIAPKHRKYVSHSYFDIMEEEMERIRVAMEKEKEQEAKKNPKNKEVKKQKKQKIDLKKLPPELRAYD